MRQPSPGLCIAVLIVVTVNIPIAPMRPGSGHPDPLASDAPPAPAKPAARETEIALARGALRAIADGIVTVDPRGRIASFNPAASHMVGWSESEALGRHLHEVLDLRDADGAPLDLLVSGSKEGHDVASLHALLVEATFASVYPSNGPLLRDGGATDDSPGDGAQGDASAPIGAVVTFRNVTRAKRHTDELAYQASHDALTGVANRRAFEAHLQRAVESAARQGNRYSLLFLDMDRFKAVNDSAGHAAGDALLRQLAVVIKKHLRDRDVLARLGGDEFAVLLDNAMPVHANLVAERLRDAVAAFRFNWQGELFSVGVSIGQVNFSDGALTLRELMHRADKMCYLAKRKGRNRVAVDTGGDPRGRSAAAIGQRPPH